MASILARILINDEETELLINERTNRLYDSIKNMEKDDIKEMFKPKKENEISEEQLKKANEFGKRKLYFIILFLSIILFTFHLVSIYEINGIIHSIQDELIASVKSFLTKKDREATDDFYQNFNKLNRIFPNYSIFYISSLFSGYLSQCLDYIFITIFSLCINFLTLFFGFRKFKFNIERNKYNNYDIDDFFYLYLLYLILCIFQGFISLYPLNIIKKGFEFYYSWKDKIQEKNDSNQKEDGNETLANINGNIEIKNNENIMNKYFDLLFDYRNKKLLFFDGYFIFFLASLVFSVLIKTFLDQQFIGEYNYASRKKSNYYIIISYCASTLISLFFYYLYKCFLFNNEKKEKKINTSSIELFGYLIYNKSIESENMSCCQCCEDCKICCETLNRSLCLFYSCKACCGCMFSCDLTKLNVENDNQPRKIEDINKKEEICIIYRLTGLWNWLGKVLTSFHVYFFAIVLYISLILNMGFEDKISDNIEKNIGGSKNVYLINGITLIYILLLYLGNKFLGSEIAEKLKESGLNLFYNYVKMYKGMMLFLYFEIISTTIFSALIYFEKINKIENYILAITIGNIVYIKIYGLEILSLIYEVNSTSLVVFSYSSIISFYLFIWYIILFILEVSSADNDKIIFAQFIIGCVTFCLVFIPIIYLCCRYIIPDHYKSKQNIKDINIINVK